MTNVNVVWAVHCWSSTKPDTLLEHGIQGSNGDSGVKSCPVYKTYLFIVLSSAVVEHGARK